jgi:dUTP pyrophosphatase
MFMKIELIERNGIKAAMPKQATDGSAGFDLSYNGIDDVVIPPGCSEVLPTGIKLQLPRPYEAQIRSRSGLASKNKVVVLNSPGTIDSDYRGEIGVILMNFSPSLFVVRRGDRIAQMVISRYERPEIIEGSVDSTERGNGGFGSTGTKGFDVT